MSQKPHSSAAEEPAKFLSPAELSQRWKVSGMTLRRWRADNKIRALHIGRQIRFAVSEIERFEAEAQA
jgi:excisionase family DNA binding protein